MQLEKKLVVLANFDPCRDVNAFFMKGFWEYFPWVFNHVL